MRPYVIIHSRQLLLGASLLAVLGCGNAGDQLGFNGLGTGGLIALVCLDRDLSRSCATGDTAYAGIRVGLVPLGSNDTIATLMTDAVGSAQFTKVPVGRYRLIVDSTTIGDSLVVGGIDSTQFSIALGAQLKVIRAQIRYPVLSVRQARIYQAGKRIWIEGVVLAPESTFGDTTAHVSDSSGALRLTKVVAALPSFAGDSVRAVGTVNSRGGQPTLDQVKLLAFVPGPPPVGVPLSTARAATADGGQQDAALVAIAAAVIIDTVSVGPDLQVRVNDGTGDLLILLDGDISFNLALFVPGLMVAGDGVLVPGGPGQWLFKPRNPGDVTVN